MKIYLYTNFTFGAGFMHADLTPEGISRSTLPSVIRADFTNGACRMVLKSLPSENLSFLMVKDIIYLNEGKRIDEQGRKIFINFAIGADDSELSRLGKIFKGFLANYSNVSRYIGTLYSIPAENSFNYDVDYDEFIALLNRLESLGDGLVSEYGDIDNISSGKCLVMLKGNDESYYAKLKNDFGSRLTCKYHFIKGDDIPSLLDRQSDSKDYDVFSSKMDSYIAHLNRKEEPCLKPKEEIDADDPKAEPLIDQEDDSAQNAQPHLENEHINTVNPDEVSLPNDNMQMKRSHFLAYLAGALAVGTILGIIIGKFMSSN